MYHGRKIKYYLNGWFLYVGLGKILDDDTGPENDEVK